MILYSKSIFLKTVFDFIIDFLSMRLWTAIITYLQYLKSNLIVLSEMMQSLIISHYRRKVTHRLSVYICNHIFILSHCDPEKDIK